MMRSDFLRSSAPYRHSVVCNQPIKNKTLINRKFYFLITKKENTKDIEEVKDVEKSSQPLQTKKDIETQRKGYLELGQICLSDTKQIDIPNSLKNSTIIKTMMNT